jgi:hypothetical protein
MSIPPEALIDNFNKHVEVANELKAGDYELSSHFNEGYDKIEIDIENIVAIEPGAETGTFIMRLKREVADHRGPIMIITGASLLALGGLIIQRRKSHKDS